MTCLEDNRFLRCVQEHRATVKVIPEEYNRFTDTAETFKRDRREQMSGAPDFSTELRTAMNANRHSETTEYAREERKRRHIEDMERELTRVRKKEERLKRANAVKVPTKSTQDVRTRSHTGVESELLAKPSFEEQFPLLPASPIVTKKHTTPQLPNSQEIITVKELPLPEPVGVAFRANGTSRVIYSFENPDLVPEVKTVTIIEKAKSACWSQRLKDSLQDSSSHYAVPSIFSPVSMWGTNIDASDQDIYPQLQSVLRSVDPDLDPDEGMSTVWKCNAHSM